MIYLPNDLSKLVKDISKEVGIRSPAEALRVLLKRKGGGDNIFRYG